ncbi:MAG: CoB--CoM heterodisulfide reductase iron-sulfur subunit A family protein [Desulfomonile tiedjei]|nr:CoB--CoM heterodisulfide reductase iron-sulfur subunit A family protein [Desulfomonile tiedjei]
MKVRKRPRYVDQSRCTACGACAEKCPTKVPNEFNFGLDDRKAIYKDYAQGIPSVYTIDPENCRVLKGQKCGVCAKVCQAKAVDYDQKESFVDLNVAAVIVSTGYELFDATQIPEYGYGKLPNVISSLEMERLLSAGGPTKGHLSRPSTVRGEVRLKDLAKLIKKAEKSEDPTELEALQAEQKRVEHQVHKYHTAKKLGFIQCVGSRDFRFHKYCSSYCCMHSIKEAIIAKEHEPATESFVFYMDLRTVGKGFEEYKVRGAKVSGLQYVRGRIAEIAQDEDLNPVVRYEDTEQRKVTTMTLDMVILANACSASRGIVKVADLLGLDLDDNNFVRTHPNRPLDTNVPGIFTCGCAQGPLDIPESVAQASSAAARAAETVMTGGQALAV